MGSLKNIELIKNIAILFVLLNHCMNPYTGLWVYTSAQKSNIFDFVARYIGSFHMALFVFCSGYISFYKKDYKMNIIELIKKKYYRLIIPFIFVTFLWIIPVRKAIGFYNHDLMYLYLKNIILGVDPGPTWFLLMLFNIFVIVCIFYKLVRKFNYKIKIISLILLFFISEGIRDFNHPIIMLYQFKATIIYLPFFILGGVVYGYREIIDKYTTCISIFFLGSIHLFIILTHIKIYNNIVAIIGIIFWLMIINKYIRYFYEYVEQKSIYQILNKYSFSIYLFHEPIIFIILTYYLNINPLEQVVISVISSFIGAILIKKLIDNFSL